MITAPHMAESQSLRLALIEAAHALVDAGGERGLSIRALARSLGVSSAAPFRHFPDREALLSAVADQAGAELDLRVEEAAAACSDALTQFRAMSLTYVRFAAEHSHLFDLIHSRPGVHGRLLGGPHDQRRLRLIALIVEGQNAGLIPPADPELVALTHEALTHGLARMIVDRHPRVGGLSSEDARKLALAATQLLQTGIGLS